MLEAVPRRNMAAEVEQWGEESAKVSVPLKKQWWQMKPVSWVIQPKQQKTFGLDHLGSEVLDLCDGSRTVERIVDEFAARHKLTFHESRVAVTGFLKSLVQRGILAIEQQQ